MPDLQRQIFGIGGSIELKVVDEYNNGDTDMILTDIYYEKLE